MRYLRIFIIVLFSGILTSCITSEKLTYLQYVGEVPDTTKSVTPSDYRVLPYDNLFIRVVTPDPQWSDMFNTIQSNSQYTSLSEQSADLVSYTVGPDGFIELPFAGKVAVSGKTLETIRVELEAILKSYVADAAVTVKMINNYVSVIGEVRQPGKYLIYKDRMNIFQALALAGDLGDFSDRQKLQVIRQIPGGNIVKEFSLLDRGILTSEFFYVMPNDVIYAKPTKGKFFQMNSFPYTIILGTITTFILLLNVIKQ